MQGIFKRALTLNLSEYPNIGIDFPIGYFLLAVFVALIITTIAVSYRQNVLTVSVSKLLRKDAIGEENAVNLFKLGFKKSSVNVVLSAGGKFKKIFGVKGRQEYTYEEYNELLKQKKLTEEKIKPETAEIYLKRDSLLFAKRISETTPPTIFTTVLFCILILAVYVILLFVLPDILNYLNGIMAPQK